MNDRLNRSQKAPRYSYGRKNLPWSAPTPLWSPDRHCPEWVQMAAQKREAGKNYIGLLSDELEAPQAAALSAADRPIRNYVLGLMANLFSRRREVR